MFHIGLILSSRPLTSGLSDFLFDHYEIVIPVNNESNRLLLAMSLTQQPFM